MSAAANTDHAANLLDSLNRLHGQVMAKYHQARQDDTSPYWEGQSDALDWVLQRIDDIRAMWPADQVRGERAAMLRLIADLTDGDDCWFDHHGGCQAHGYLSLEPGEKCPQQEAKELVEAAKEAES